MDSTPRTLADFVREALRHVREVGPEEARRILEAPSQEGWHFVDVREPDEFAAGHVPGARNLPRGFLEVRADLEHPKRDAWLADRRRLYQHLLRRGFSTDAINAALEARGADAGE